LPLASGRDAEDELTGSRRGLYIPNARVTMVADSSKVQNVQRWSAFAKKNDIVGWGDVGALPHFTKNGYLLPNTGAPWKF
jgi:hypothetical protein